MTFDDDLKTIHIHHSLHGCVHSVEGCKDEEEAWEAYLDDNRNDIDNGLYESPGDTTFDRTYHRWTDNPAVGYEDCHEFARKRPIVMAEPAPRTPSGRLPDALEPRVSPADQMAALTGGPVEPARPEPDEPKEPRADAKTSGANRIFPEMAPFDGGRHEKPGSRHPAAKAQMNNPHNSARPKASDPTQTTVSPPAPAAPAGAAGPKATSPAPPSPQAQDRAGEISRSPQGGAPVTGAAVIAAALTGGLRRAGAAPLSSVPASADARATAPRSLLDRLALKSILDNLRRLEPQPAAAPAASPASAATPAKAAAGASNASAAASAPPSGGLRDKLAAFTAERMQPRREAEHMRGAARSGAAVLASLEALERQETAGVLERIRDAARANGGIERVLSEMRPGGDFEDLRKEFNTALSHDEGFAAAYHKAATALGAYAETRAAMTASPRADANLARLETLDREIGAAVKHVPGVEDGKSALDEALEGGREAVEKTFSAIRQAFSRDADLRGPSLSPGFGP
jgi:hypothetical protein